MMLSRASARSAGIALAGNGPPPKKGAVRRNKSGARELVKYDGNVRGYDLPDPSDGNVLPPRRIKIDGEWVQEAQASWHPMTQKMWDAWRSSPQAVQMMTEVDWAYLMDTMLMHHSMWVTGSFDTAAEVRQRMSMFGATPSDRARLRMEVEVPNEKYPVGEHGAPAGGVAQIDDQRRKRLANE